MQIKNLNHLTTLSFSLASRFDVPNNFTKKGNHQCFLVGGGFGLESKTVMILKFALRSCVITYPSH